MLAPAAYALSPQEIFERLALGVWVVRSFDAQEKLLGLARLAPPPSRLLA